MNRFIKVSTLNTTTKMTNVSISMDDNLIDEIDKRRGDVPRSAFLRRIILKAVGGGGKQ